MSSGNMEAAEPTNKDQLDSPTNDSCLPDTETTLVPTLCPRSPKGYNDKNGMLEGIDDIRNDQPCSEVDGSINFKLPKKTHQDFFEKLMTQVEDQPITNDVINTISTDKELGARTDSNENIAGSLESEMRSANTVKISEKVGIIIMGQGGVKYKIEP